MQSKDHQIIVYGRFAVMMMLSFFVMFTFMYAMVDKLANVYPNLNQAYMAGLMVAPMAILELLLMGACIRTRNGMASLQFSGPCS